MILRSVNPYTNKVIEEYEEFSDEIVERILIQSGKAFDTWKRTGFQHRASLMLNVASKLRNNIAKYAGTITAEMGKPIKESRAEVEKCAWVCEYYAQNAEIFLQREPVKTDADISFIDYEPLGPILGIMPWNFPFWQVFRFAVPTLMAGNTILLKHSSNVQICARMIEELFATAGFPEPVFRNIAIVSGRMEKVIRHEAVKAVSLTGSDVAGQMVAEVAGNVIKKTLLELGGSNAFIVLDDAILKKAAETGIKAKFQNAGQSCIAAKRFIIDKRVIKDYTDLFLTELKKLKIGDPMREDTDIGPLATIRQAETVQEQVTISVKKGAKLIAGGERDNAFYTPALLTDVVPGMPLFDEEVFGPVAPFTVADNEDEAVSLAENTSFGLGVSLFTGDLKKAERIARCFHDGSVFINGLVKSDPRLPFGGTRRSGYGRELSVQGIREFVNIKTVWIRKP